MSFCALLLGQAFAWVSAISFRIEREWGFVTAA
jgi:hypothetical protein